MQTRKFNFLSLIAVLVGVIFSSSELKAQETSLFRLLDSSAYDQLKAASPTHKKKVLKIALDLFIQEAKKFEITENKVSEKIMLGEFVPHIDDLLLVYESLNQNGFTNNPKHKNRNNVVEYFERVKPEFFEKHQRHNILNRLWVERFGSVPEEFIFLFSIRMGFITPSDLSYFPKEGNIDIPKENNTLKREILNLAFGKGDFLDPHLLREYYKKYKDNSKISQTVSELKKLKISPILYLKLDPQIIKTSFKPVENFSLNSARITASSQYKISRQRFLETARVKIEYEAEVEAKKRFKRKKQLSEHDLNSEYAKKNQEEIMREARKSQAAIGIFLYSFANSALYEFGDELFCYVFFSSSSACLEKQKNAQKQHIAENRMAVLSGTFVGYLASPVAFLILSMVISLMKGKLSSSIQIFYVHFVSEIIEGFISALGEFYTFGDPQAMFLTLVFAAMAGFIRGIIAAVMFAWKKGGWYQFVIILTLAFFIMVVVGIFSGA